LFIVFAATDKKPLSLQESGLLLLEAGDGMASMEIGFLRAYSVQLILHTWSLSNE
jgi:hypothetical protein